MRNEKRHIFLSCHARFLGVLSRHCPGYFSSQNGGAADRNLASKNFRLSVVPTGIGEEMLQTIGAAALLYINNPVKQTNTTISAEQNREG